MILPPAVTLGSLTFGAAAVAWGALACAVPVVIHLALRRRARRQVFPALRFLLDSHPIANRAHRLKHLLLMATRMLLILLLVALLADARYTAGGAAPLAGARRTQPVSAILCLDDSASMAYRFRGQTRFERSIQWARQLVADANRFPPASEFAIVTGSSGEGDVHWVRNRSALETSLDRLRVGHHDRPAASLLERAYQLLDTATHAHREIYLFNDLTAHGWASSMPPVPPAVAQPPSAERHSEGPVSHIHVLDAGQQENRNVSLNWPRLPDHAVAPGLPASFTVRIRTGDLPAEPLLEVSLDGHPHIRQSVAPMEPNSEAEVEIPLPPLPTGTYPLTVTLEPEDALGIDNRRFGFLTVGELPAVVIAGQPGGEVAAMVSAMIAPAAQPRHEHRFALGHIRPSELAAAGLDDVLAVILADVPRLEPAARDALAAYATAGGSVLVMPGPQFAPDGYEGAGDLLPAAVQAVATADQPLTLAAGDLSHPYLQPFRDAGIDSINNRQVFQRLVLGSLAPRSSVIARFSDGQPALLERPMGRGRVILLAFSPARTWGQFGTQAAPTIVLLHSMLTSLAPRLDNVAAWAAGHRILRSVPAEGVVVQTPDGPLTPPISNRQVHVPTEVAGHHRLTTDSDQVLLYYSVNVPQAESDPSRISEADLLALLPPGRATLSTSPGQLPHAAPTAAGEAGLLVPIGLGLLALILIESLFANRFYGIFARRPVPAESRF